MCKHKTAAAPAAAFVNSLKGSFMASLMLAAGVVQAAELPEGSVVSKANIDKVKDDTFMGQKIADLLAERMDWELRNTNRKFTLTKAPEPKVAPKWTEASQKYSSAVRYNAITREVSGYQAGLPFPAINEGDSSAGEKIMWNYYFGATNYPGDLRCDVWFPTVSSKGFEASQFWLFDRIRNRGRLFGESSTLDESDWLTKTIFVGVAPQDIKGTGTFTIRYDAPAKLEDQWVYVKSARRTRRLTGNAWMDPVGSFDFLNDDIYIYNARPSQYKQNKLIGKRWILAATNFNPQRNAAKAGTAEEWAYMDMKEAPYWNVNIPMTPREVYIVEATPPAEHPYSKKVMYVDSKVFNIYRGEFYDKKGEFWRLGEFFFTSKVGKTTGVNYTNSDAGVYIDFKARHATHFVAPCTHDNGAKPARYSAEGLETFQ